MLISLFQAAKDNQPLHIEIGDLEGLFEAIGRHDFREDKDGPLWSPAEFQEGTRRANANVIQIHFGVVDFDDIGARALHAAKEALSYYEHIWHTTWKHAQARRRGRGRYRAIVALSRPVPLNEWDAFWPRFVAMFGGAQDESCRDPARMYYLPSAPTGTEEQAELIYQPGYALDVDDVLLDPLPEFAVPVAAPTPEPLDLENYTPSPWAVEWALNKLDALAREVEKVNDAEEPMHPILNKAAFTVGGMIPHLLEEEAAALRLLEAALWRNPGREEKYIPIITRGLESGQERPFTPEQRYAWTDTGNAERIRDMFEGKLHYVSDWKSWLVWGGANWSMVPTIQPQVKEAVRRIHEEAANIAREDIQKTAKAFALKSESASSRRAAEFLVQSEPGVAISHHDIDADPWVLGCTNGILDLRTGKIREATPADLITRTTLLAYDPAAEAPTWENFLLEIMGGDESLVGYLRRAVGYSITGDVQEQKLFFLYGKGANGKSTFVNALLNILGTYAAPGAPELLMQKKTGAHPTEQADLVGRRLVSSQEIEEGRYWNEALLKQLTGGDPIQTRRMHEDFWTFQPTHKFWVSGNHKPNVRGTDDGIWRRLILIPFEQSFKGREDRYLPQRLRAELPGILAWAVRGCLEWQESGLEAPEEIEKAVKEYRSEQDIIAQFLKDRCEQGAELTCSRQQLRSAYEAWCDAEGDRRPFSPRAFNNAMRDRGFVEIRVGSDSVRSWAGVRVKPLTPIRSLTPAFAGAS